MKISLYNILKKKVLQKDKILHKTAIIFENKEISFKDFLNNIEVLIFNIYKNKNFKKKKIFVSLENSDKFIYLLFAASELNIPLTLLSSEIDSFEISNIDKDSITIIDEKNINKYIKHYKKLNYITIDDILKKKLLKKEKKIKIQKQDNFIINYSSGSTGNPKKIIYTQEIKLKRAIQLRDNFQITEQDKFISYAPIHHSLGQRLVFSSLLFLNTLVLQRKFNFYDWEKSIKKYKVNILFPISSHLTLLVKSMLNNKKNYTSVKKIIGSSSQISKKVKNIILRNFKDKFYEAYGAAELAFVSILRPSDTINKKNSVGKIVKGAKVLMKNRYVYKNNQYGEICCASEFMSKFSNEETNNKDIFYKKKYFRTGDIGYFDKDNYLYFVSRKKDIIIKSGINIIPKIIEDIILQNKIIKNCAVIGVKDEIFGESPVAICETEVINEQTVDLFEKNIKNQLTKIQLPSKIFYVKKLKYLSSGKINKEFYRKKI